MASHKKFGLDPRVLDYRMREFGKEYQFYDKEPKVALKAFNNNLAEYGLQPVGAAAFNASLIRVFGIATVLVNVGGKTVKRLRS